MSTMYPSYLTSFTVHPTATLVAVVVSLALANYFQRLNTNRSYWSKRGVKGKKPWPIFSQVYGLLFEDRLKTIVADTKKYGKVHGSYFVGHPFLVVADAEVLRQVAIKDFESFQNHQANDTSNKYQRNSLLWLKSDHWKRARALMTPSFTSGKIKRMYRLLDGCANDLVDNFKEQCSTGAAEVDLFATYGLYTMNGITTCGYGLQLQRQRGEIDIKQAASRDSLIKDISQIFGFSLWRITTLLALPQFVLNAIGFELAPESVFKPVAGRIEALVEKRRRGERNHKYDDLLQLLVDAKLDDELELDENEEAENHHAGLSTGSLKSDQERLIGASQVRIGKTPTGLTDLEIVSQAIFLLAAGLDTTRASMSTITYLLAHHQEVEERLYQELRPLAKFEDEANATGRVQFDYDQLSACQYLDAVISESLRMFGPAALTDRVANADYYIEKYDIHVPKGSLLLLGMHSVQNDPDYWDEPDRFDPGRFMPGRREHIVPGSYAPFSLGSRHCIGMRFSLTETKLGLAKVLMELKFTPAPNTKYPPEASRGISVVSVRDCRVMVTPRRLEAEA